MEFRKVTQQRTTLRVVVWWSGLTAPFCSCYIVIWKTEDDWEEFLTLVLYAYRTAVRSSTRVSPFQLMFGRSPAVTPFQNHYKFVPMQVTYKPNYKQCKILHANLAKSAEQQKRQYDRHTTASCSFNPGDPVWLSVPTARNLQPHWEGKWTVSKVKGPCNVKLSNGHQCKVVHVNRVSTTGPNQRTYPDEQQPLQWNPPDFPHLVVPDVPVEETRRYPLCDRHLPDRLRY